MVAKDEYNHLEQDLHLYNSEYSYLAEKALVIQFCNLCPYNHVCPFNHVLWKRMPSVGRLCTEFFYAITPSIFPCFLSFCYPYIMLHSILCLDMLSRGKLSMGRNAKFSRSLNLVQVYLQLWVQMLMHKLNYTEVRNNLSGNNWPSYSHTKMSILFTSWYLS